MNSRLLLWIIILLTVVSVYANVPKLPQDLVFKTPPITFSHPVRFLPQINIPEYEFKLNNYLDTFPLKLGLDLQGGTQLVLEAQMDTIESGSRDDALESAREVIERRVNLFGVSESIVQSSKVGESRRILVDLPGIKDASEAANLVGRTAQLEIREQVESTDSAFPQGFFFEGNTIATGITGADLKKAQVTFGGTNANGGAAVSISFTPDGARKFGEVTKRNLGKQLPIFLDDVPISAPYVESEILDGNALISGNFSSETAKELAVQLNAGALPVPIKIIEQRSIGPSLGQESVNKSLVAGGIGLITVMIYMLLYYGKFGLVADIALIIYTLISLVIFRTGLFLLPPVTLTLAGIAGFILSIGMAVDANILIFERIKEERRWGKNEKVAFDLGFRRAWSSIRDSNVSSLITASILYFLGTGLVKGFAITLAIGVLVSMFTAITVTRTILRLMIGRK